MAVQDVNYELGSACLYTSSASSITIYWGIGSVFLLAGGYTVPLQHILEAAQ